MKIAINARFLHHPFGGIGQYLLGLLDAYARSEHPDELVLYTHLPVEDRWQDARIQIKVIPEYTWIPTAGARKTFWEAVQFPRAVAQDTPTVGFIPYPSCTRSGAVTYVHCVHDVIPWVEKDYRTRLLSKLYHSATKRILREEQHIITVSEFSRNEIARVLGRAAEKIEVIHPGSCFDMLPTPTEEDVTTVRKKHGLIRPYVLYVGGYDKRKGVDLLLASYLQHVAPRYDIDLVLVGHPLFRTGLYMDPSTSAGAGARGVVRSVGTIPTNEELFTLYKGAHGFVSFSTYEGFNLPLLQAVKAQLPSLVFPIPPHVELFKKTFISLLRGDEQAMWDIFLTDEKKRHALIKKTENVAGRYDGERMLGKMMRCWSSLKKD